MNTGMLCCRILTIDSSGDTRECLYEREAIEDKRTPSEAALQSHRVDRKVENAVLKAGLVANIIG